MQFSDVQYKFKVDNGNSNYPNSHDYYLFWLINLLFTNIWKLDIYEKNVINIAI